MRVFEVTTKRGWKLLLVGDFDEAGAMEAANPPERYRFVGSTPVSAKEVLEPSIFFLETEPKDEGY